MNDKPLPQPSCPFELRVNDSIPMAHVADVDRSSEFYALLGFGCDSRFSRHDGITNFAMLSSDRARIMLVRASEPINAGQQAVLFYMYTNDVAGLRKHLLDKQVPDGGLPPAEDDSSLNQPLPDRNAVFNLRFPFYMPEGELRIHDLDGYCILVGQLG